MRREEITGLVLAGGRGSRMGGVDKGLQRWRGRPLVAHALDRLAPQVGTVLISANRNLPVYKGFGLPVVIDETPDFAGPLAGLLSGLAACETTWLASVPCDTPGFPLDLVERLGLAIEVRGAKIAMASIATPEGPRVQPVFALMHASLHDDLRAFVRTGGRRVREWMQGHDFVEASFDDRSAFANLNTPDDLQKTADHA